MALRSQSHAYCYFTGVVNVGSSNIVLKSETVFANTILIHPRQRKELRVLEICFEERIIEAQHEITTQSIPQRPGYSSKNE